MVCREGGTSGGTVGRATADVPRDAGSVNLREWKAPIRDEHFIGSPACLGLLSESSLQGGCSGLIRCRTHEQTGDGEALCAHGADTRGDAQRDSGQRFASLGTVMLGRTLVETWPPEPDQITGNGPVAPMPVSLPLAVVLHHALPGGPERRDAPAPIRECGPGPPHGRRTATKIGKCGNDRTATLEQAPTEQCPQEVEKAYIGPKRHIGNNARQNVIDTVEYG